MARKKEVEIGRGAESGAHDGQDAAGASEVRRGGGGGSPRAASWKEIGCPRGSNAGQRVTKRTGHVPFYHRARRTDRSGCNVRLPEAKVLVPVNLVTAYVYWI